MLPYAKMVRKALSKLRQGKCDIYNLQAVRNDSGITETKWEKVASGISCHLSYKSATQNTQTDTIAVVTKATTLFVDIGVQIKDGSRIEVTQNGITQTFKATGEPSVYATHQEIGVILEVQA